MNAVEIEEAISALAERPFEAGEFPFAFLRAFGNRETTIKRLRSGASNSSNFGGVLQRSNIHIKVCPEGEAAATLVALEASPATARAKAKFVLATDGREFHAEDLNSGDVVVCDYPDFPDHFGFFLPLAGITTVRQIRESAFDIKATGRLNRLYVELLKENPAWGAADSRPEMNHFMARLIFCFFAEDTDIFNVSGLFTDTIERMSAADSSNTHEVIGELFRAMNTDTEARKDADVPRWADSFPYVNGGLFSESTDVQRFSRIARSYLLHIGNLDWKKINPDIFGSMIQAVADDEERGALGMHYTSVPNILKVLNPLFLDDLREKLEDAGTNSRKLLNLRNRMARIRVFDPACGSGNFLVIAYKEMREIEAEINKRRREIGRRSDIPLINFRGIELRDFPAEIARLALVIAEYQCDVLYRGHPKRATCNSSARPSWRFRCHRRSGALPAGNRAKPSTPSTHSDDDQASHQRRPAFPPGQPVGVRRAPALQGLGAEIVELRPARVAVRRIGSRVPGLGVPAAHRAFARRAVCRAHRQGRRLVDREAGPGRLVRISRRCGVRLASAPGERESGHQRRRPGPAAGSRPVLHPRSLVRVHRRDAGRARSSRVSEVSLRNTLLPRPAEPRRHLVASPRM